MTMMTSELRDKIMQNKSRRIILIILSVIIAGFLVWGLSKSNLGKSESEQARAAQIRGAQYAKQGKYDKAISCYDKAANLDPSDSLTYFAKAFEISPI